MSSGCRKCGKPAWVKPNGSEAVLCAECLLSEFSELGIDIPLPGCTCGGIEGHHLLSCALRRPTPRALDAANAARSQSLFSAEVTSPAKVAGKRRRAQ